MREIYNNIKKYRELKGYTQQYVAEKLGITQKQYSNLESGFSSISIDRFYEIAEILETDIINLLDFDKNAILKGNYNYQKGNNNMFRIDPIEKVTELYERLLSEKDERIKYLEQQIIK